MVNDRDYVTVKGLAVVRLMGDVAALLILTMSQQTGDAHAIAWFWVGEGWTAFAE